MSNDNMQYIVHYSFTRMQGSMIHGETVEFDTLLNEITEKLK